MDIIDTTSSNILEFGICGYKNKKRQGFIEKIEWVKEQAKFGLKIKTLFSKESGAQGMIEYIPGKYCWKPVEAPNYMFIHCLFVGHKKEYKNNGHGTKLIEACINDAKNQKMSGVAVVARKGSFMANNEIFIKNGFEIVDNAKPDFHLLVKTIKSTSEKPKFKDNPVGKYANHMKG
ncbi:GNAT family N-acetyltransferase, partial [Desulfobacterales bacterium HSG17]|nr:GNAT family N-acetyltransferase [Desulfobacterales bacterium HSG17]